MEEYKAEIGRVVFSMSGRDKGSHYVIFKVIDDDYVEIIDGETRKIDKPKRKKLKHLKLTSQVIEKLAEKISKNMTIFDSEVRSQLKVYNDKM